MTAENIVTLLVLAFVVYQIQKRIKILGEGEAFVVIILGRYKELNNSAGLHFKTSGSLVSWERIKLGQAGVVVGDFMANFNGLNLPISTNHEIDTLVKIQSFKGNLIAVTPQNKTYSCVKCGHENHI